MHRRRTLPAGGFGEAFSRHALVARSASSSLRQVDPSVDQEVDPDLAALKSSWNWNFAGAPRTAEQEDKQWFSTQTASRPRRQAGRLSCARCGQSLRMDELISHQAHCLGEREDSSEDDLGTRPRWRGPLDKDVKKASRLTRLPDLGPMDFMDFSYFRGASPPSWEPPFGNSRFQERPAPRHWASSASSPTASSASPSQSSGARASGSSAPPPQSEAPPRKSPPALRPSAPTNAELEGALASHEGSWARFDSSQASVIRYTDVPWPDHSKAAADRLLVQQALRKAAEGGDVKAALRKLQLRWHPDKWAQRFAARLAPEDSDRVLTRVKEIAQIVNSLKAST